MTNAGVISITTFLMILFSKPIYEAITNRADETPKAFKDLPKGERYNVKPDKH